MKTCNKCSTKRDSTHFGADNRNADGLQGICQHCRSFAKKLSAQKRRLSLSPVAASKKCNKCLVVKSSDGFFKDSGITDGLATVCKECRKVTMKAYRDAHRDEYNTGMRNWRIENKKEVKHFDLMRSYGLSLEKYTKMLIEQNHVCKMCRKPPNGSRPLAVDHDHSTGEIRGLVCYGCNRILHAFDTPGIAEAALKYLKKD